MCTRVKHTSIKIFKRFGSISLRFSRRITSQLQNWAFLTYLHGKPRNTYIYPMQERQNVSNISRHQEVVVLLLNFPRCSYFLCFENFKNAFWKIMIFAVVTLFFWRSDMFYVATSISAVSGHLPNCKLRGVIRYLHFTSILTREMDHRLCTMYGSYAIWHISLLKAEQTYTTANKVELLIHYMTKQ